MNKYIFSVDFINDECMPDYDLIEISDPDIYTAYDRLLEVIPFDWDITGIDVSVNGGSFESFRKFNIL